MQPGCTRGSAVGLYKRKCSRAVPEEVQLGCTRGSAPRLYNWPLSMRGGNYTAAWPYKLIKGSAARLYNGKCSRTVQEGLSTVQPL